MDKRVFDDAIGEVPPSTVDVDAVIVRGRRADRVRRVANPAVAAGVAVVLLTGAVAYTMTRDQDGGATVGTAPPTSSSTTAPTSPPSSTAASGAPLPDGNTAPAPPSMSPDDGVPPPGCAAGDLETAGEAAGRLRQVVTDAVLAQRPDLQLVPNADVQRGTQRGPLEFYQPVAPPEGLSICDPQGSLESAATTKAPDGDGNLLVAVRPDFHPDHNVSCEDGLPNKTSCGIDTGPHGEEIVKQTAGFAGGVVMHRVEFVREDGTLIMIQAENVATSSKYDTPATATAPPLTLDQLITVATDPDLTLFP